MTDPGHVRFRLAAASDAEQVAALHADSWRRHYRGAYSDAFLDGEVLADRRSVWTQRLDNPRSPCCTFVAEEAQRIVGFAHAVLDDDATWGALLDNLHVTHTHMRRGIGSRLLALTARAIVESRPGSGLYLWVLEQNVAAQAFYTGHGGRCVERDRVQSPGGDPGRLHGSPFKLRYVWPDPGEAGRGVMVRLDSAGSS